MDGMALFKGVKECFPGKKVDYTLPEGVSYVGLLLDFRRGDPPGIRVNLDDNHYLEIRIPEGKTKGGKTPRFRIIVGTWADAVTSPGMRRLPKIMKMFPGDTRPDEIIAYLNGVGKKELIMILFSM